MDKKTKYKINNNICQKIVGVILPEIKSGFDLSGYNEKELINLFYQHTGINKFSINGDWEYVYSNIEICETFKNLLQGKIKDPIYFEKQLTEIKIRYNNLSKVKKNIGTDIFLPILVTLNLFRDNILDCYEIPIEHLLSIKKIENMISPNIIEKSTIKYLIKEILNENLSLIFYEKYNKFIEANNQLKNVNQVIFNTYYHWLLKILDKDFKKANEYFLDLVGKVEKFNKNYYKLGYNIYFYQFLFLHQNMYTQKWILSNFLLEIRNSINYILLYKYHLAKNDYNKINFFIQNAKKYNSLSNSFEKNNLIQNNINQGNIYYPNTIFGFWHKKYGRNKCFFLTKTHLRKMDIKCYKCHKTIKIGNSHYSDRNECRKFNIKSPISMCVACCLKKAFRIIKQKPQLEKIIQKKKKLEKEIYLIKNLDGLSPSIIKKRKDKEVFKLKIIDLSGNNEYSPFIEYKGKKIYLRFPNMIKS